MQARDQLQPADGNRDTASSRPSWRWRMMQWVLVLFPLSLAALHPSILNRILRWLLARTGHRDVVVNITMRDVAIILTLNALFWLGAGVAFYLLTSSIYADMDGNAVALISVYSLSTVAALTFCVTPGCLGVREGALAVMPSPLLPAPTPAIIALAARLWLTVAELVCLGLGVFISMGVEKTQAPLADSID